MRKFEKVKKEEFLKYFSEDEYSLLKEYDYLPKRGTKKSAGYDFTSLKDYIIKPNELVVIPLFVKVKCPSNEYLGLYIRSSLAIKNLHSAVGIIDSDYYGNDSNDGHIFLGLRNLGSQDYCIAKGDRLAQGIFQKYYTVTDENEITNERSGGFGSTNTKIDIYIAEEEDAPALLKLQKKAFKPYAIKYGDFDGNPCHMKLERMKFNINYIYGKYYKVLYNDIIIGGIFGFELDDCNEMKIAQLYIDPKYHNLHIGTKIINHFINHSKHVTKWYVDTIKEESYNMGFYQSLGFEIIDEEEEHAGLTFVTMLKKMNI